MTLTDIPSYPMSRRLIRRSIRHAAFGCCVLLSCQLASADQQSSAHPPAHTKVPLATQQPSADRETRGANRDRVVTPLLSKIWWNQPKKIEQLSLSDDQRTAMDALLSDFLGQRASDRVAQIEAFEAFGQALGTQGAGAARREADAVGEAVVAPIERQIDLMIAVVDLLSAEQRQQLVDSFPRLLGRPWIRNASPLSAPISMAERAGGRGKGRR